MATIKIFRTGTMENHFPFESTHLTDEKIDSRGYNDFADHRFLAPIERGMVHLANALEAIKEGIK